MHVKKSTKALAAAAMAMVLAAAALQGCGGKETGTTGGQETTAAKDSAAADTKETEDLTKDMEEFTSNDGSISIMLGKGWTTEDMGMDFWLAAQSKDGSEAVIIMQFPKAGSLLPVDSISSMKTVMAESYGLANESEAKAPSVPGMTGVEAAACTIDVDGETADAYMVYGETDYAFYAMMFMAEDEMDDDAVASAMASCETFKETPLEIEDNSTVEVTDTVKWFNASYAVLTSINGWDYNRFGGLAVNDANAAVVQELLNSWWDVSDRASADENLDWILTEGHRANFVSEMKTLEEAGLGSVAAEERPEFILGVYEMDAPTAEIYSKCYSAYETAGEKAIDGWDYCRALNLLGYYYTAGYYTDAEALDKSLEIAQTVQAEFGSWDELVESYMVGYEYWAEESGEDRRSIYEDLKTREDNPYAIDFKMTLEKTW